MRIGLDGPLLRQSGLGTVLALTPLLLIVLQLFEVIQSVRSDDDSRCMARPKDR